VFKLFINFEYYRKQIKDKIIKANLIINSEVKVYLETYKGPFSKVLNDNYKISKIKNIPLCQDTGIVEFFLFLNKDDYFNIDIQGFLDSLVKEIYSENNFRFSTLRDPYMKRKNTFDNLPSMINIIPTKEKSNLSFLIKGGGSENLSFLKMLKPTISKNDLINEVLKHIQLNGSRACPPLVIGVGLGGTAEKAVLNSKISLLKNFNDYNKDEDYKNLEKNLETKINNLNIGVQGLKEGKTTLSTKITVMPSHIASLSLAISVDCYLNRKGVVYFEA
jgi:fumarate hydratase subunit alpha